MAAALIFDVDGTLSETEEVHRLAFNEAFREFGLPWDWNQRLYRALLRVSGGKERITHYVRAHRREVPSTDLDGFIRQLHERKTETYTRMVASGVAALRPGVERILTEARQAGRRLAIATTTSMPNVEALLEATLGGRSIAWFEVICAGDSVPRKKPAPDIYRSALSGLRLEADACVAFEDSENGLRSARGADIATIVTPALYTDDQDFAGAALVVDHLGAPGRPSTVLAGPKLPERLVNGEVLDRLGSSRLNRRASFLGDARRPP